MIATAEDRLTLAEWCDRRLIGVEPKERAAIAEDYAVPRGTKMPTHVWDWLWASRSQLQSCGL